MDVHDKVDEIAAVIESARAMPMSASCVLNRTEVLTLLDELRALLPRELDDARAVLGDRAAVVEDGRREAEQILAHAHAERARLVDATDVVGAAAVEADRLLAQARAESEAMRRQVDDYVDGKLANFEVVLHRTLTAVAKGRDKLRGRSELDRLDAAHPAHPAGPDGPGVGPAQPADRTDERLAATG